MIKVYNPLMMINSFLEWFPYNRTPETYVLTDSNFEPTENLDEVLNQDIKIATIPMDYELYDNEKRYKFNPAEFDLCLISDIEYNTPETIQKWIDKTKIKNYLIAYGAPFTNAPTWWFYRPWWCFNILDQNQFQDISQKAPLFEFDILLGAIRHHRNFLMAKLQNSSLLDKSIVTYRQTFSLNDSIKKNYSIDNLINYYLTENDKLVKETLKVLQGKKLQYPYVSPNLDNRWEVKDHIINSVSELVPWRIYEHTKYSVVCETKHNATFITEKIGKVLFGKRIFVLFGSHNYLATLRQLGFKTFDGIIDESYDKEFDEVIRFSKAFEQLEWLSNQDHKTIIDRSQDIVNHNHNHLIKYRQEIKEAMTKAVYNKIKEIKNANSIQ